MSRSEVAWLHRPVMVAACACNLVDDYVGLVQDMVSCL